MKYALFSLSFVLYLYSGFRTLYYGLTITAVSNSIPRGLHQNSIDLTRYGILTISHENNMQMSTFYRNNHDVIAFTALQKLDCSMNSQFPFPSWTSLPQFRVVFVCTLSRMFELFVQSGVSGHFAVN